jgi:hypothetical protein
LCTNSAPIIQNVEKRSNLKKLALYIRHKAMNPKTMMDCGNFTPNWTPETIAQNVRNKLLMKVFLLFSETKKVLIIMQIRQNVKELYDKMRP